MTLPNKITDPTFDTSHSFFSNRSHASNYPNKFAVSRDRKICRVTHRYIQWSWRNDLHRGLLSERAWFIDLIERPSSRFPKRSALIITDVEDEKRFAARPDPVNLISLPLTTIRRGANA